MRIAMASAGNRTLVQLPLRVRKQLARAANAMHKVGMHEGKSVQGCPSCRSIAKRKNSEVK